MDECEDCGNPATSYCRCCFKPLCRRCTKMLIRLDEPTLIVCEDCKRGTDSASLQGD